MLTVLSIVAYVFFSYGFVSCLAWTGVIDHGEKLDRLDRLIVIFSPITFPYIMYLNFFKQ